MLRIALILNLFFSSLIFGQLSNDNCAQGEQLCPNTWVQVDNFNSTATTCLSCEDDFDTCFVPLNSSWFTFTTYAGGNLVFEIQNITFNPAVDNDNNSLNFAIFQADVACFAQSYNLVHCANDLVVNATELVVDLEPNTVYHVVFSGTQNGIGALEPSEATFLVRISGPAVDRPAASVSIGASPAEICRGEPVTFIADLSNCPDSTDVQWFKNDELWLTVPSNAITTEDVEDGDVFYAVTTCFDVCIETIQTNNYTLIVHDFLVYAGEDVTIIQGDGIQLTGFTTENFYYWSPELGLTNPNITNPIASPNSTTTYNFHASNGICEIVDGITITVVSDLVVPNVFSPNGDGINDVWEILGTENYEEVYVLVYDRSGQKVLESVNYNPLRFWDGSNRGKPLPVSTYYYVITVDRNSSTEKTIKGPVTIVR
jgi:gliding motility-associated-like protein